MGKTSFYNFLKCFESSIKLDGRISNDHLQNIVSLFDVLLKSFEKKSLMGCDREVSF